MLSDALTALAVVAALAIVVGELRVVWWVATRCLRRWRGGALTGGRVALEASGVFLAVVVFAWGAAVTP